MSGTIAPDAPASQRLRAYLEERFPPVAMAVFSAVTVLAAAAAVAAAGGARLTFEPGLLLLAVAHLLTLLLLRVLDEHKDFARDAQAYPERVLSRGVVDLALLRRVGWGAGLAALAASAALGPAPLVLHAAVLAFGLLMAKEFFLGDLLRKDVLLYAVAHQPINPLVTAWVLVGLGARGARSPEALTALPPALGWFVLAQVGLGFGWEVARKLWTPEEERPGLVDSYSAHAIGPRGAALLALGLLLGGVAATCVFVARAGLPPWVHLFPGACGLLALLTVGRFAAAPFAGASKKLAGAVGLGSLALNAGLVAGAIAARGVAASGGTWGWGAP